MMTYNIILLTIFITFYHTINITNGRKGFNKAQDDCKRRVSKAFAVPTKERRDRSSRRQNDDIAKNAAMFYSYDDLKTNEERDFFMIIERAIELTQKFLPPKEFCVLRLGDEQSTHYVAESSSVYKAVLYVCTKRIKDTFENFEWDRREDYSTALAKHIFHSKTYFHFFQLSQEDVLFKYFMRTVTIGIRYKHRKSLKIFCQERFPSARSNKRIGESSTNPNDDLDIEDYENKEEEDTEVEDPNERYYLLEEAFPGISIPKIRPWLDSESEVDSDDESTS